MSPAARLRLVSFFIVFCVAYARQDSLFTSSVTYCAPPETLLVQQFDVAYIAWNNSVFFNISAASVEPNVNVTANLLLNVYGMQPANITVDLCSLLNGDLCPLPMYNFTGTDWLGLPSSLGVPKRIPSIAFKIPDLEAFAQLTLVEVGTGDVKACVQSTLSNGWSTRQTAVEWSTACLALVSLFSAIWQSRIPDALAPYRLIDFLFLLQSVAMSGFLNINYPSAYRSFTLNFAWSMGLIFTSASSPVQIAINRMRHLTGGNMADASGVTAIGLVNRKLSPYNVPSTPGSLLSTTEQFLNATTSNPSLLVPAYSPSTELLSGMMQLDAGEVVTVTPVSSNVLQAGVPIYVNSLFISTANAFMTIFIYLLILVAIETAIFGLGYIGIFVIKFCGRKTVQWHADSGLAYRSYIKAWSLRLCLIAFAPVMTFAIYQWTIKDSWLSLMFSVLLLILLLGGVMYPMVLTVRLARRSGPQALFSDLRHITSFGPLFAQYRPSRYYFSMLHLVAALTKASIIGFGKNHGQVQVVLMIIVEFLVLLAYPSFRPCRNKSGDVLGTFLAAVRLVTAGLMVAFIEHLALAAIPRVVIGIVIVVIFSIAVVVMAVNILTHVYQALRSVIKSHHPVIRHSVISAGPSDMDTGCSDEKVLSVTATPGRGIDAGMNHLHDERSDVSSPSDGMEGSSASSPANGDLESAPGGRSCSSIPVIHEHL